MTEPVGQPDGPLLFVPELGIEVGTFTSKRADLAPNNKSNGQWLMHHVPSNRRGTWRITSLPKDYGDTGKFITDELQYVMCSGFSKWTGDPCGSRAVNSSHFCSVHGGALHPLDKVRRTESNSVAVLKEVDPATMTRWQQLCAGFISADDLDDEELARGRTRDLATGRFIGPDPRNVPKALHDRMVKELFQRADQKLKENLLDVVDSITEIAKGQAYEPADRLKAATWVFERLRGKAADVVVHTQDKPWEHIYSNITGGSRAESRAARGIIDVEADDEILPADYLDEEMRNAPGNVKSYAGTQEVYRHFEPVEEIPVPVGDPLKEAEPIQVTATEIAPQGPEARARWEAEKAEERRLAEDPAAAAKALKDRLAKARGKRYAARAMGQTNVDHVPMSLKVKVVDGKAHVKFVDPVAPKGYGKRRYDSDWD